MWNEWREKYPERDEKAKNERIHKGGKFYERNLEYQHTGLQQEKHKIRMRHFHKWNLYKGIIAPTSQIHHEWIPGTSNYRGVALVEANKHMHGFIDVIEILDGEILIRGDIK